MGYLPNPNLIPFVCRLVHDLRDKWDTVPRFSMIFSLASSYQQASSKGSG